MKKNRKADKKRQYRRGQILRIIMTAVSLLGFLMAIGAESPTAAFAAVVQIIFLVLTFTGRLRERINLRRIFSVGALLLVVPWSMAIADPSPKRLHWPDNDLAGRIPEPETNKGSVYTYEDSLSADLDKVTASDFEHYVNECKDRGFTVYAEEHTDSYSAADENGYVLSLNYYSYSEEMDLSLEAPKSWSSLSWPVGPLAALLPEPPSEEGYVEFSSDSTLQVYVKDVAPDQFTSYINAVMQNGFNIDYSSYDDYFAGKDSSGKSAYITLQPGHIMHIVLYAGN